MQKHIIFLWNLGLQSADGKRQKFICIYIFKKKVIKFII